MLDIEFPDYDPRHAVTVQGRLHRAARQRFPDGNRDLEILNSLAASAASFRDWLRARDAPTKVIDLVALLPGGHWRLKSDGRFATLILHASEHGIWQLSVYADGCIGPEHEHLYSPLAGTSFAEASIDILGRCEEIGTASEPRQHPVDLNGDFRLYTSANNTTHAIRGLAETEGGLAICLSFHTAPVLPARRDDP